MSTETDYFHTLVPSTQNFTIYKVGFNREIIFALLLCIWIIHTSQTEERILISSQG